MPLPTLAAPTLPPLSYLQCLSVASENVELVEQFSRLTGITFDAANPRNGLEALIDDATGFKPSETPRMLASARQFALFVREFVWLRLPPAVRMTDCWVPQGDFEPQA